MIVSAYSKTASRRSLVRCLDQTVAIAAFFLRGRYVIIPSIAALGALLILGNCNGDITASDTDRFKVNHYFDGTESKPFTHFV